MQDLTALEQAVLDMLLADDHPVLTALRTQLASARLVGRRLTGVGFFLKFEVPEQSAQIPGKQNFELGDVDGTISGLKHGAGFVLFIRDGRLNTLEGYSYGEPWPANVNDFQLTYDAKPRNLSALE